MITKTIQLRQDDESVTLTAFVPDKAKNNSDAMLIIPGGGYTHLCTDREGDPVAIEFAQRGFISFVLSYSVGENAKFPQPLIDASLAMAYIKRHSDEFNVNPERVFALGFSAGGNLATMLGTLWNSEEVYKNTDIKFGENKPTGIIPLYPVITSSENETHMGSFMVLTGKDNPTKEELEYLSLEKRVSDETVPAFIAATVTDRTVPVISSIYLAEALAKHNIPFELHIYPTGPHGLALATSATSNGNPNLESKRFARWVDDVCEWIEEIF